MGNVIYRKVSTIVLRYAKLNSSRMVVPIVITYGSDYMVTIIQLVFVGHLGSLELAGAALGSSFCNVTGFSVCLGLLSALDTLTAQAYGAKKLGKVGEAVQQSIIVLTLVSLLVLPLWLVCYLIIYFLGLNNTITGSRKNINSSGTGPRRN